MKRRDKILFGIRCPRSGYRRLHTDHMAAFRYRQCDLTIERLREGLVAIALRTGHDGAIGQRPERQASR
jgi:hypothetical protein